MRLSLDIPIIPLTWVESVIRFSSAASMFLIRKKSISSTLDDTGAGEYFKPNESVDGIPSTVL